MKELFVCEKPSVAGDLALALSKNFTKKNGYLEGEDGRIYTFAFGHLVSCVNPEEINSDWGWKGNVNSLPFFLKDVPLKVKEDAGIKKQYKIIVELMKRAGVIYIATDAGREGEHIFRKIYRHSGMNKPLKRLWMQDMTNQGILKAFDNVKDGSFYEGLAKAGQLREEADLLIGINSTQLITKLSKSPKLLSLGRVQTPTLAMVVNRDQKIENFSKVKHFSVEAKTKSGNIFELVLDKDVQLSKAEAMKIQEGLVRPSNFKVDSKKKKEKPKKLFNLTDLQRHMNEKYKWSADQTLKITQQLYEKKLVTYPRTNSQYLASDSELYSVLEKHSNKNEVKKILDMGYKVEPSFINPEKVTDHEAIIITTNANSSSLKDNEKVLYNVIFTRFVAAFYPAAVKEENKATFEDGQYLFSSSETVLLELGWKVLYGDEVKESILKNCTVGDIGPYNLVEKETSPPKRYTESTLLGDMENAGKFLESSDSEAKKLMKSVEGIGTVATRAAIIEILVKRGFIEKKKGSLVSTNLGRELIAMMPADFSLYSVRLTSYFESLLLQVEKEELSEGVFYDKLEKMVNKLASEIKKNVKTIEVKREVISKCPKCGREVYETKVGYSCSGYNDGCKLTVWKNGLSKLGKKTVTKSEAKKLLKKEIVNVKLKSQAGKPYEKKVKLDTEKSWIVFAN